MDQALEVVTQRNTKRFKSSTWYQDPGVYRITDIQPRERKIASKDIVELHLTNNSLISSAIVKTMLREIHESQNSQRIAAFAGCIVAACFRDFVPTLISAFEDRVGEVNIVDDVNRAGLLFELDEPDSAQQTAMSVAQIILIMFKNINQNSYEPFLIRRIKALKAIVGIPEEERVNIVMPIEKALMVRARLGSYFPIKKRILEILLVHRGVETALGAMCNYLCNILEWHEMTSMLFIIQTVIVTDSPVLYDLRISSDVLNFLEAAKAVQSSSYYGYFRIRETNQFKRGLVERAKFPLLSAIAQQIKSQTAGSATNYQGMPGQVPAVINLLVMKHNHYIAGTQSDLHREKLRFLTQYTEEEET